MTMQWTKSSIDRKAFDELRLNVVIPEAVDVIGWSPTENQSGVEVRGE